jgi:hypothetical protein
MADVNINIFTNKVYKQGASTVVPGFIEGEEPTPINPSGSGGASEFVPYVGATENFDLGEFGLSAGFLKLDTTPTNTPTDQGTMYWDEDDNTVDIILNGYIMKVGEDLFYPVKNQTGSSIAKGTNVGFAGTLGMSGRLLITPYLANGANPTSRYMGVTAETIADGEDGKVLWFGRIRGINTNAFNEGDILYASTSSAGAFQTTLPVAPNNIVEVAAVVTKSSTQGVIFVRPQFLANPQKIDWLTRTINNTSGDINALPTPTDYIEITAADAINGIIPTSSGWIRIVNRKASSLLLRSNNTNASTANRLNIKFQFLTAGDGLTLFYDRNTEKWIADDLYSNDIWEQFNLSSNTNNLGKNPATNRIRIGGSGAIELTGVANCQNGQFITIFNSKTSENITIKNNSLSSTDVNRFDIGADIILEPNRFLPFVHENGRLRRLQDLGNLWTDSSTFIYRNSPVLIGGISKTDTTSKLEISGRVSQVGLDGSTFFGFEAGLNDDLTTNNNTAFGYQAGKNATSFNVVAIGYQSGYSNTSGNGWVSVGAGSGYSNTTGSAWTALGGGAGSSNETGNNWMAIGVSAGLNNTSGSDFVAIGVSAGSANTSGSNWITIGINAGRYYSGGTSNANFSNGVYIGHTTKVGATNATNEIVIGYQAEGIGSNTIVIGNTSITNNYIRGNFNITDGRNLIIGTTTGTKIGTATSQKLAFWNKTPIVQPTTAIAESAFVENSGGVNVNDDSTFDGYTLRQVVKALRDAGLLA